MWATNKAMEFNDCKNIINQESSVARILPQGLLKGIICSRGENLDRSSSFCQVFS